MMRLEAVVLLFDDLDSAELAGWIDRNWVRPRRTDGDFDFRDVDIARVRLIHDLHRAMAIAEDTVPLVLSLLDQVYALRGTLTGLAAGLAEQPEPVQAAVLEAVRRLGIPSDAR